LSESGTDQLIRPESGGTRDHLVVLVHGINTRALWMGDVKPALESAGFTVAQTSYGRFSILRFLPPFRWLRNWAINRVATDIRTARRSYKIDKGHDPHMMSVISHSFGTYVVSRLLTDYPEFQWYRIIFCGSVVREDFPLHQVLERFSHPLWLGAQYAPIRSRIH
jgi:pimeloyl-ACP methyl ester carboxylesterase